MIPDSLVILIIATTSFLAGVFALASSWAAAQQEKPWALAFSVLWVCLSLAAIGSWFFFLETPFK